jgi:uncharacterized protein (TIGR02231 family)
MKKAPILLLFGLFLSSSLFAQKPLTPESKISEVTVYLSGAQITREAKVTVSPGKNEVVLEHLEEGINPATIQVTAPPEILLTRVTHEVNYLKSADKPKRILQLEDSLKFFQNKISLEQNEINVLNQEKAMILANQSLRGDDNGVNVAELQKAADFFRTRLTDIHQRMYDNGERQKKFNEHLARIENQMNELNYRENQPSNDVVVFCESKLATTYTLRLRYVVSGAGWSPSYDLRAKDTQSPLQLDYRADVTQATGLDWKDVKLTLSTGNPFQGGTKPTLSPNNLYVYENRPVVSSYLKGRASAAPGAVAKEESRAEDESASYSWSGGAPAEFGDNTGLAIYTTVNTGATMVEFRIQIPQDIPNDGKVHQVMIQSAEVKASYRHFAVPKLDPDAFLMAQATEWESLNLLPGTVNIFFEGTYVTQSVLDPTITEDTLNFSLGRDKKVVITREQLKDFTKKKTIGFTVERQYGYEITVRNTKTGPISITLEDQIPISQDKTIEIKLEESSGAKLDPATGQLLWELTLGPSETKKLKLIYTVKHPKNKYIQGL